MSEPRLVLASEIDELMEWGLPLYQGIYPRCTADSVRPMLEAACQGGPLRFTRTENGAALFVAERTPWEPELFVYQVLVVTRIPAPGEAYRLVRDAYRWAWEIGAVGFQYGRAPTKILNDAYYRDWVTQIKPDLKVVTYVKVLR